MYDLGYFARRHRSACLATSDPRPNDAHTRFMLVQSLSMLITSIRNPKSKSQFVFARVASEFALKPGDAARNPDTESRHGIRWRAVNQDRVVAIRWHSIARKQPPALCDCSSAGLLHAWINNS